MDLKCQKPTNSLHCCYPKLQKAPSCLACPDVSFQHQHHFSVSQKQKLKSTVYSVLPPDQYPICHIILANLPSEYLSDSSPLCILALAVLLRSLASGLLQLFPVSLFFYLYYLHPLLHSACKYLINLHASPSFLQTLHSGSFLFIQSRYLPLPITHFLCYLMISPLTGEGIILTWLLLLSIICRLFIQIMQKAFFSFFFTPIPPQDCCYIFQQIMV